MNLFSSKRHRDYSNCSEFSWSWILRDRTQARKAKRQLQSYICVLRKTLFTEFYILVDARAELVFGFKNYCFFDVFVAVFVFIFVAQRAWYIYAIMVHVPLIILFHKSGPLAKFHQICYLCLSHFIHHTRFPLPKSRPLADFNHSQHIWQIHRFHSWWHSRSDNTHISRLSEKFRLLVKLNQVMIS